MKSSKRGSRGEDMAAGLKSIQRLRRKKRCQGTKSKAVHGNGGTTQRFFPLSESSQKKGRAYVCVKHTLEEKKKKKKSGN